MDVKYYGDVDISEVLKELKTIDPSIYKENKESDHPNSTGLLLKFPDVRTYNLATTTMDKDLDSMLYPDYYLFKHLEPLINKVIELVDGQKMVWGFIISLAPGGKILPHKDTTKLPLNCKRIHVPLQTKEGNLLKTGDTEVYMKTGEVWWFNNHITHSGVNNSNIERIHLVMDIMEK